MEKTVKCLNTATGHFELATGNFSINQDLEDIIQLMCSIPDPTGLFHGKPLYHLNKIEFVGFDPRMKERVPKKPNPVSDGDWEDIEACGLYVKDDGLILLSPVIIAKHVARLIVKGHLGDKNIAVDATHFLLGTLAHELGHAAYATCMQDNGSAAAVLFNEDRANAYEQAFYPYFIKTFGMSIDVCAPMWGAVALELNAYEYGRAVLEKQRDWMSRSIVYRTDDGRNLLSVREGYRQLVEPRTDWKPVRYNVQEALEILYPHTVDTSPEEPVVTTQPVTHPTMPPARRVPPPPPPASQTISSLPSEPPARRVPPPPAMPSEPPLPPVSVYENEYVGSTYSFIEADNKALMQAIQATKNSTKNVPKPPTLMPTKGSENLEQCVKQVAEAIYKHLIEECGDTGPCFTNPDGVYKDIVLGDSKYIHSFTTQDPTEAQTNVKYNGSIRGYKTSKIKMPAYSVTFKDDNGRFINRMFLPQNPNTGSKMAQRALEGDVIMWITEPSIKSSDIKNVRDNGGRANKMAAFIDNFNWITIK